jgi:hypothetical protein
MQGGGLQQELTIDFSRISSGNIRSMQQAYGTKLQNARTTTLVVVGQLFQEKDK